MIPELDRAQGIVLRQLLLACDRRVTIGLADVAGRKDAFYIDGAALQIKHSTSRLPPWRFTYFPENIGELNALTESCDPVWVFLVCGVDGVVGLSLDELRSIIKPGANGVAWVRVTRPRNGMYRVFGSAGELEYAKPRGVQAFVTAMTGRPLIAAAPAPRETTAQDERY